MQSPFIELDKADLQLLWGTLPVHVLKAVDLRVDAGEIVAIQGPPGAGKTSLLTVIAGLQRPTGGSVRVAGQDLASLGRNALALYRRSSVGIVFANFNLIASLTAVENVAMPLEIASRPGPIGPLRDAAAALLGKVGLGERLEHLPKTLSGGEQQRVAVARALITRPRLLLADEPTGNLDGTNAERIADLMFGEARAHGTAVLVVTHDAALAARADRRLLMDRGRLVAHAEAVPA